MQTFEHAEASAYQKVCEKRLKSMCAKWVTDLLTDEDSSLAKYLFGLRKRQLMLLFDILNRNSPLQKHLRVIVTYVGIAGLEEESSVHSSSVFV